LRRYAVRRALQMVPTVLGIVVFTFILLHLAPGDPARALAGEHASPENIEAIRRRYGLDKPMLEQLWLYMSTLARGDLGYSYATLTPVTELLGERLWRSAYLMVTSLVLSLLLGVLLGTFAASRYPSKTDSLISMSSVAFYSMPVFWVGLLLIHVFAIRLNWLPSSGMTDIIEQPEGFAYLVDVLRHSILPIVTLTAYNLPMFIRVTRASVIETANDEYVTTGRAIGLRERRIYFRHALRNAMLPVVTLTGLLLGFALTGAILTEAIFGWPGVGQLLWQSIQSRDYPTLMAIFLLTSITVVIASFLTDLLYHRIDPRVRLA
jgi:peptide/nickel transport system permease protein